MLRRLGMFSLLLLAPLVSVSVVADVAVNPADSSADQSSTVVEKKVEKMRCRRVEQRGSHIKKRVCRTPAEWNAERERDASARQMRGLDSRGRTSGGGEGA